MKDHSATDKFWNVFVQLIFPFNRGSQAKPVRSCHLLCNGPESWRSKMVYLVKDDQGKPVPNACCSDVRRIVCRHCDGLNIVGSSPQISNLCVDKISR